MTALKVRVIAIIESKSAYLYSIGNTSPEYNSINYFFVFFEVGFRQHEVSHILLRHLNSETTITSIIGIRMLKQRVRVITTPILKYQSAVISSYVPLNRNYN